MAEPTELGNAPSGVKVTTGGSVESPKVTTLNGVGGRQGIWDKAIEKVADIPWGLLGLIALIVLVAIHKVDPDQLRAFATAAGLLGVGHGIHTGAKSLGNRRNK